MPVVLLVCAALLLVAAAAWTAYRHRAARTWDRELDAAFDGGDRRPLAEHRAL
jgi:hypothetical protein